MKSYKSLVTLMLLSVATLFVACSEEGDSTNNVSGIGIFDEKLPECGKSNECEQAYVKSEKSYHICVDGEWLARKFERDTLVVKDEAISCSTEPLDDNTGFKILCNGNSIGVILNRKDTNSCSVIQLSADIVKIKCGDQEYLLNAFRFMTDSRDGQIYKTVKIGTQTWMAENLNYAYNQKTSELDSSSFCYNDSTKYCEIYGRLYLWSAAMDSAAVFSKDGKGCGYAGEECSPSKTVRGVCPEGWHLPSYDEWEELIVAVGDSSIAGKVLKAESNLWNTNKGTDTYGFSALPAGYRYVIDEFEDVNNFAYFWSSTENDSYLAHYVDLYFDSEDVYLGYNNKVYGSSVRCLQD